MPTAILVRHGRSTANAEKVLAGRGPGVTLDELGRDQAVALAARLAALPLAAVVSSPLERCRETVRPLLDTRPGVPLHVEERLTECGYGDWTGRKLAELADEPLWKTVQRHPSAAVFPGPEGESMRAMYARAVDAVRDWDRRIAEEHGPDALYLLCSHGDVIKAITADALGLHLDLFQRIAVEPCSVTAIRYTPHRPFVLRLGDTGDLAGLAPRPPSGDAPPAEDAVVGGGTGTV
jgi:probable phosphomutase (TIGR03848 family)